MRCLGGRMLSQRVPGAQNWVAFHATRAVDCGGGAAWVVWYVME